MSHEPTDQTKLGPGFDVTSISGAGATIYARDDAEMEETASSPVQFLGETIPESTESSVGLTPSDVPAGESTHSVMGLRTVETRKKVDADTGSTVNVLSGEIVSNPGASGSQAHVDVAHQKSEAVSPSIRSRSKSPLGRALSPRRAQSAELRARFA